MWDDIGGRVVRWLVMWCSAWLLVGCGTGAEPAGEEVGAVEQQVSGSVVLTTAFNSFDFSALTYTTNVIGDFFLQNGSLMASGAAQRGLQRVRKMCASPDEITEMPTSGYVRTGVTPTVGDCYVALTHRDERNFIVFRVTTVGPGTVSFVWRLVASGYEGATLVDNGSNNEQAVGYDFSARAYRGVTGGDFYFGSGHFWTNNVGQRGVLDVGTCASLADVKQVPQASYLFLPTITSGHCYVALNHNEERGNVIFRVDSATSTRVSLTWKLVDDCYGRFTAADRLGHVNCWLSNYQTVANQLVWETGTPAGATSTATWSTWPNALRDELRENVATYNDVLRGRLTEDWDRLDDPPTNIAPLADNDYAATVLSERDARRLYVKTIAMSLAVEMTQFVPWSITRYSSTTLASLFDSRRMLKYTWPGSKAQIGIATPNATGYILVLNSLDAKTHKIFSPMVSSVVPAPPDRALRFILDKQIKGGTRRETIERALEWTLRLQHFTGESSAANFQKTWQYRGGAPVTRTLAGTIKPPDTDAYHFTAGCWGTSALLHSLLRTLNIPVDANPVVGGLAHSLTRFTTEALTLSHGDDPYFGHDIYGVPVSSMLLDEATFQAWFVNVTPQVANDNIGRGPVQAQLEHLSLRLQDRYCSDPVPGANHATSGLTTYFDNQPGPYTLSYLESLPAVPGQPASLWDRLAQKVAANGGCTKVMQDFNDQWFYWFNFRPRSEQLNYN